MARPSTGSVRKLQNGRWEVRVAGKSRRATSRAEAERVRRQMLDEHDQQPTSSTAKVIFGAMLDDWMSHINVAPKTLYGYQWACRLPAIAERAHMDTARITSRVIEDILVEVQAGHGASSARAAYRALSAAFGWAMRRGRCGPIATNPMIRVDLPKSPRQEPVVPTPAAIAAVMSIAEPDFAALLRVAIATGARRSEIAALQWSDVNFDDRCILICRAIDTAPGPLTVKQTKSNRSRTVSVDDATLDVLRAHADAQITAPPNGWIWSRDHDGRVPIRPDRINVLWRRVRAKVPEIEGMRFHDLRHTAITWLIMSGADPRTVAARAGHSSPNITLAVYTAHVAAADRSAADTMGRLLLGSKSNPPTPDGQTSRN